MPQPNVIVICGPTASGKSRLAADIARHIGGTVVNADSMQLYRGLPVLTAVPDAAARDTAPHALYEVLGPSDTCSARLWRDMAIEVIDDILTAGGRAVLTGGTGLYLNALIKGLSPVPDVPEDVRRRGMADMAALGPQAFHARLAAADPAMAARLDPANRQRLVRAWEVLAHTGKSLAHWQGLPPAPPPAHFSFLTVTLAPVREKLYARCDARLEAMLAQGALEEVAAFAQGIAQGDIPPDAALTRALGYRELAGYIAGQTTRADAVAAAQQATRRYAKRQTTWFHHQMAADMVLETPCAATVLKGIGPNGPERT